MLAGAARIGAFASATGLAWPGGGTLTLTYSATSALLGAEGIGFVDRTGPTIASLAYDTYSNPTTLSRSVEIALAPPPAPTLTQPVSGLVVNQGSTAVTGTTAHDTTNVTLFRNGVAVGSPLAVSSGTFAGYLDLANGANQLQAVAVNRVGQGPLSQGVLVTLDRSIPQAPFNLVAQSREMGQIRLVWRRADDPSIDHFDVYRSASPFDDTAGAQKSRHRDRRRRLAGDRHGRADRDELRRQSGRSDPQRQRQSSDKASCRPWRRRSA